MNYQLNIILIVFPVLCTYYIAVQTHLLLELKKIIRDAQFYLIVA